VESASEANRYSPAIVGPYDARPPHPIPCRAAPLFPIRVFPIVGRAVSLRGERCAAWDECLRSAQRTAEAIVSGTRPSASPNCCRDEREGEVKGASRTKFALNPDSSPMSSQDAFGDIKSQPKASAVLLADLPEALEHRLQLV
jgi:hypothetical protein